MRAAARPGGPAWQRFLPLAALVLAMALAYALGLHRYLSLEGLRRHRDTLQDLVAGHPLASPLGFVALYALATALSVPGAVFLTLAGGLLFGCALGATLSVLGATLGAVLVFMAARTAIGQAWRGRVGPWLDRVEGGLRAHAFSYLLALRLVPLFPFWLVNLAPAFVGVSLRTYALATFLGIIPGAVVYAGAGSGLGGLLDRGGRPDLGLLFEPRILLPLLGLALLALLPVAWRGWRRAPLKPPAPGPS